MGSTYIERDGINCAPLQLLHLARYVGDMLLQIFQILAKRIHCGQK